MRVGLVDVDGHNYPNYALMKISAWHKQRGDSVEWADPMFGEYDRVYMSKVFTFTEDNMDIWNCEVVKGGTGYDIASKLPEVVISRNTSREKALSVVSILSRVESRVMRKLLKRFLEWLRWKLTKPTREEERVLRELEKFEKFVEENKVK